MNTRSLMELIVLNVGYELGIVAQGAFTLLVLVAILTTVMTGPLIHLHLRRAGLTLPQGVEA